MLKNLHDSKLRHNCFKPFLHSSCNIAVISHKPMYEIYITKPNFCGVIYLLWCSVRAPEWPPHLETITGHKSRNIDYKQIMSPKILFTLGGRRRKRVRVTVNRCNRASAPFRIPELPTNYLHTTPFNLIFSFALNFKEFQRTFPTLKCRRIYGTFC